MGENVSIKIKKPPLQGGFELEWAEGKKTIRWIVFWQQTKFVDFQASGSEAEKMLQTVLLLREAIAQ